MKAITIILTGLLLVSTKCFASAGYAHDGLMFIIILCSILMVIAGLLYTIDYISKNGRMIWNSSKLMITTIIRKIKNMFHHREKFIAFPHTASI
jgi:hypothetical protein